MPRRRTSVKKTRVDKKRHQRNLKIKKELKKTIKKFQTLLTTNAEEAKVYLKKLYSQFDKAAKKKIIHPSTAERRKSRLTKKIK